jgi:predicted transcriptional regulator
MDLSSSKRTNMEQPMDDRILWQIIKDAWRMIQEKFDPAIQPFVAESSLSMREWMLILAALTFEPEDTTPSHLMVRGPYTSSDRYLSGLEKVADAGYFEQVGEGRYRLTDSGRGAANTFIELARKAMTAASLPDEDLSTLATLFDRLVKACLETAPPPDTWSIDLSNKLMPSKQPPLPFIEQAISCLAAYRDDAHLASWCSSGLSASAMECLSLVWRDQASSIREVFGKLEFRGHPESVYLDAIVELKEREYLEGSRNSLRLTESGMQFREQVEELTDQYFYNPWSCISDSEKKTIAKLLSKI